ncbi:MAG: 50S ribosomal protein L21 [Brevundimonas sp.]|jgi:large subunit ribosomal protein L21|uniref:50S ribosomal protein L21 n=1 Tax=Brevundimonas sp. TaxID=1871086 RepID=UPI00391B63CA
MYAVIKTGGKQYRVQPGDVIVVEKLDGEPGADVSFGEVLMLGGDKGVSVGAPVVDGASVAATLIETRKGEKVKIFKKIRRQGYRRTKGHRQMESVLRITGIEGADESAKWDGEVSLMTKAEMNARARGLAPRVEEAAGTKAAPKKAAPKKAEAKAEVKAQEAPASEKPAAEKPAAKKAAPKKAEAKAEAATEKKAAPKKAAPKKADPKADPKADKE